MESLELDMKEINQKEAPIKKLSASSATVIQVASSKPANFYISISKMNLKDFSQIEPHAVGNATSTAVLTAENLVR